MTGRTTVLGTVDGPCAVHRPEKRNRRLGLVALVLVGSLGCGDRPDVAPAAPSCGSYEVSQGDFGSDMTEFDGRQRCLLDAFEAGTAASLSITTPTVEGDPIEEQYTVVGRRLVEVRTDTTEDEFGPKEVTTQRCTGLRSSGTHLVASDCRPVG